jgi:transposase
MAAQRLTSTTDLTEVEWQILEPLLPPEKTGGRPRQYPLREVITGLQYSLRGGCAWRLMPHDLPQWPTAYQPWRAWRHDGTWREMHEPLRDQVRTRRGRHPPPSAASIEAQTVKTTNHHPTRHLAQQMLETRDHSYRRDGTILGLEVHLSLGRDGGDGREMIEGAPLPQDRRLPHGRIGAHDAGPGIEPGFVYEEDGLLLFLSPFLIAGHVSVRQWAIATSSRWRARRMGF